MMFNCLPDADARVQARVGPGEPGFGYVTVEGLVNLEEKFEIRAKPNAAPCWVFTPTDATATVTKSLTEAGKDGINGSDIQLTQLDLWQLSLKYT